MLQGFKRKGSKKVSVAMETFRRMSILRYLYLEGTNLTGKFKRTLADLRWFYWERCPLKCLPFDFCPKKLVILELPRSKMITMWDVNMVGTLIVFLTYMKSYNTKMLDMRPPNRTHFCRFQMLSKS